MAKVVEKFVTPVGRLVGGGFFDLNTKDQDGRDLDPKKYNWWVGLAFPKTAANWWEEQGELGAVFQAILKAANAYYVAGETQQPTFAWKISNGDDPKFAGRQGYPGHWIIGFSRNVAIDACPVYNAAFQPVIDKNLAKKGYYYRISGSTSANEAKGLQAGVYINMDMAQLLYAGEEIISGPAPASVFGAAPAMPAGATVIGAPAPVAAPAPTAAPVAAPAPTAAPVAAPAPTAAPVAAPVKVMTEKAAGATYEQFVAQGWSDQAMVEQGYMVITTPAPGFLTGDGY